MPAVFVLVGAPGSGKSTQAKELQASFSGVILCPDEVRVERQFARQGDYALYCLSMGHYFLRRGRTVIYDATNAHPEFRRHWIVLAQAYEAECYAVWMDTSLEECLRRHQSRELDAAHTGLTYPIIERYYNLLQQHPPTLQEGFASVRRITQPETEINPRLLPTPQPS